MKKARHEFDKSSKWLIQKHGNGMLYLGGIRHVRSWRALQAELVQPRRLPDGLLEVFFHGRETPDYFLLEVATYPEKRISDQALNDLSLAYHQLQVLPELLTVVLHPKGQFRVQGSHEIKSRLQWSQLACRWKVVELWELPAEELLSAGDVGLLPWVPLTEFQGPPAPILEQCRRRIDEQALPEERANLLAVSQVLARLRYNDAKLLAILGGQQVMIESPLIDEVFGERLRKAKQEAKQEAKEEAMQEAMQKAILVVLQTRFQAVPEDIGERLRAVRALKKLNALTKHAAGCPDLEAFRKRLLK